MTRLPLYEVFQRAVDLLENERIPYLVYGGLALAAWGRLVTTEDADLVIRLRPEQAGRWVDAINKAGFHASPDAQSRFFIDKWTTASLGGRDVDFALAETPFDEEALRRATRLRLFDRDVPVATAEDLILYKLAAYRRKDLGHVEDILARQGARLDLAHLRHWAADIAAATGKFEIPATLEKMLSEQGLG